MRCYKCGNIFDGECWSFDSQKGFRHSVCPVVASEAKPPQAVTASASCCPSARAPGDKLAVTSSHCPDSSGSACATVFPVGDFINDEMQERGWSISELVSRMDGSVVTKLTIEILVHAPSKGVRLDDKTASLLARAFGTSKELWLRLDEQWQKHAPTLSRSAERARPGNEKGQR